MCSGSVFLAVTAKRAGQKLSLDCGKSRAFDYELGPQSMRKTVSSTNRESNQLEERTVTDSSSNTDMKPNKTYAEELLQPA